MPHVVISGRIHESGLDLLRARGDITIRELHDDRSEDLEVYLPEADALILRGAELSAELVQRCHRLRIVSRHGVGYDNVPVAALTAHGIPLTLVGDINSGSVAEHAFSMMIALAKQTLDHDRAVREGRWDQRYASASRELEGRSLLIVGLGKIGRQLARRALAFDMRVLAYDPGLDARQMAEFGVEHVADWRSALPKADFVSLHVPRAPTTLNMIGAAEFGAMRSDAFLINASRGGLVDEAALAAALSNGEIAGAALDVFDVEPPSPDHPLLASDRLLVSPHMAGLTLESNARLSEAAAHNVLRALDGELDPGTVVNPAAL